ncbi:tRNA (mo5U34)-methyltransferase [Sphingobium wenxiniae]|uniref:SAM-dependent methyltransferase n=2 Tax=Sphingobium TaxID=165695 RepID=T0GM55_9SPHN|nr:MULTISPECIES: TIGR04290 family methyltransferase [Sphingobium]EQB01108.1 SAM-dependent methyltransferase [Sphingobium baderi LL03]KMS61093.1 SAM-dependent methyltransferase [Sphingobium baderi LL03]MBB6192661.1 tRNA (mo5U34)-methyltransferase [Sphingobium wenxiniae]TWH91498.1 tRNA (mo5U34)-methyltransferase [Sphingobium wenxiniae]WRD76312.1 TIGR04290 family methyltransferase [Sphingobium baderi]
MTAKIVQSHADTFEMRRRIEALGPWFHNLRIGAVQTAPDHFLGDYPAFKFARFEAALPADLSGKSVLDIGCNAGFYSIEMKRRGAAEVLGIDSDERYLAQARFAAEALGFEGIGFRNLSVYDVGRLGRRFDLVIFMGVLYHLRHPLLALDLIREHVAGDLMLFQTMQQGSADVLNVPEDHPFHVPGTSRPPGFFDNPAYPRMHFIEKKFAHDWTNWWAPNAACSQAMLRAAGFTIEAQPEDEVYLCRVASLPYGEWMGSAAVYPASGPQEEQDA